MRKYLLASLGVNLFLAGMLVAPFLDAAPRGKAGFPCARMEGERPRPPHARMEGFPLFGPMTGELPEKDAIKLRTIFEEGRKDADQRRERMRSVMLRTSEILKADAPDMEALRQTFADVQKEGEIMHKGMSRLIERVAQELSPEARRKLAQGIERHEAMPPRPAPQGEGDEGRPPEGPAPFVPDDRPPSAP